MKNYTYTVYYLNDIQDSFVCANFTAAIILAMASAIQKGRDPRIKYITDEKGTTINDITFPEYGFSK